MHHPKLRHARPVLSAPGFFAPVCVRAPGKRDSSKKFVKGQKSEALRVGRRDQSFGAEPWRKLIDIAPTAGKAPIAPSQRPCFFLLLTGEDTPVSSRP
jgi:hypothetical protein